MTEIEIKARTADHKVCEKNILRLKAKLKNVTRMVDINYGRPEDLDEKHLLLEGRFVGRIRQVNDEINVEFKEVRRGGGAREISAPINKLSDGDYLFEVLGFKKAFTIKKERRTYVLPNFEICLDQVEGLGSFIEIEHVSKDGKNIERALSDCRHLLGKIDPNAIIETRKYGDLVQELINTK